MTKRHCEDCAHYAPERMTCTMEGKDVTPGCPACYWFDEKGAKNDGAKAADHGTGR